MKLDRINLSYILLFFLFSISIFQVPKESEALSSDQLAAYPMPENPTNYWNHDTSEVEWQLIMSEMVYIRLLYNTSHLRLDFVINDSSWEEVTWDFDILYIRLDFNPLPNNSLNDACIEYYNPRGGTSYFTAYKTPDGPDNWTGYLDGHPNAEVDIKHEMTDWRVTYIISVEGFGVSEMISGAGIWLKVHDWDPDVPPEQASSEYWFPSSNYNRYAWGEIILLDPNSQIPIPIIPSLIIALGIVFMIIKIKRAKEDLKLDNF